jgi:hypothetical protein
MRAAPARIMFAESWLLASLTRALGGGLMGGMLLVWKPKSNFAASWARRADHSSRLCWV